MQQGLLVDFYISRIKSEHFVKTKIRLLILAEKKSYLISYIAKHSLFSVFFYDYTCIVSTKTECVAQCSTNSTMLCLIECEVQVIVDLFVVITFFVVDCWRNNVIFTDSTLAIASTAPAAPSK